MKVGIDFDRVLFKTDEFNDWLKEKTGLHHVEGDVYDENGCYSPRKHAELCRVDVEEVFSAIESIERFLYEDVEKLEDLRPDHTLVIVTRGEKRFQKKKIMESGAEKFFDQVFTVQEGSKDVGKIGFLVDDRKEEIERAGVEGMVFDREKHSMEDVVEEVRKRT